MNDPSGITEAKWKFNMSYEQEICGLSEFVQHQKFRSLIKSTVLFKQGFLDLVFADLKSIIEFGGFWGHYGHKFLT